MTLGGRGAEEQQTIYRNTFFTWVRRLVSVGHQTTGMEESPSWGFDIQKLRWIMSTTVSLTTRITSTTFTASLHFCCRGITTQIRNFKLLKFLIHWIDHTDSNNCQLGAFLQNHRYLSCSCLVTTLSFSSAQVKMTKSTWFRLENIVVCLWIPVLVAAITEFRLPVKQFWKPQKWQEMTSGVQKWSAGGST